MTDKEHIRTIRWARDRNKLVVFVGSAASYDSGLPSWKALVDSMNEALESPSDDFLKTAELYHLLYGRNVYYKKIEEYFPSESRPNYLHELILRLAPQHIVTTNWDDLIEKAIAISSEFYLPVANDHSLAASSGSKFLVKMHGDFHSRNIVFKESDYHSYSDNFPLIENFIKSLFSTHVVLFVGYSISDYNLNLILSWIRNRTGDAPPIYTLLPSDSISFEETSYLQNKGVYPITSISDDQGEASQETDNCNGESDPSHKGTVTRRRDSHRLAKLSEKSKNVAKTIEWIIDPCSLNFLDDLLVLAADIDSWALFEPGYFVRVARDSLNIGIGKLRYDAARSVIVYKPDQKERSISRAEYRKIRVVLKNILRKVPVSNFSFEFSHRKYCNVKNTSKFLFRNYYSCFDYQKIDEKYTSSQNTTTSDLDERYEMAFDAYYLRKVDVSYEHFNALAFDYYRDSSHIKGVKAAYNKKYVLYGSLPLELGFEFFESALSDRGSNISNLLDEVPRSLTERSSFIFHDLNGSNAYILRRLEEVVSLARILEKEVRNKPLFSTHAASMHRKLINTFLFVTKNNIALLYSNEYKTIARIGFETLFKLRHSTSDKYYIDTYLVYAGLIAFSSDELHEFLYELFGNDAGFLLEPECKEYILDVLENCSNAIGSNLFGSVEQHAIDVWSNGAILLSFVKLDSHEMEAIASHLYSTFESDKWFRYTDGINRFLVSQSNRNSEVFSDQMLSKLLKLQMKKIRALDDHPYGKDGGLISNLLHLINHNDRDLLDVFNELEIDKFTTLVSIMEPDKRLRIINSFVITLYALAPKKYKSKLKRFLAGVFDEACEVGLTEEYILYGLDLFRFNAIKKNKLTMVMKSLEQRVEGHLNSGSSTGAYPIIQSQLKDINSEYLEQYREVVEGVDRLAASMKKFGR